MHYDALNNLIRITDAEGNVRNFGYDLAGRRIMAEDLHAPADTEFGVWEYGYDGNGNKVSQTDGNGVISTWTYDGLNRPLIWTADGGPMATWEYDTCPNGKERLCSDRDRANRYNHLAYDYYRYPSSRTVSYGSGDIL